MKRSYPTTIIAEEKNSNGVVEKLLLMDENELFVSFPVELLHANGMEISKDDKIYMSDEMHNAWFSEPYQEEFGKLSGLMLGNFGVLLENHDMIINNPDYSGLWLNPLKSGMMVGGIVKYSLGALLNCWLSSDDLRINDEMYMIKMGGSGLSGAGVYVGWSTERRKLATGGIQNFPKRTRDYFIIFHHLMKTSQFTSKSDIVVARELFEKLGIDTDNIPS